MTTDGHINYTSYLTENTLRANYRQQPFNVAWEIIDVYCKNHKCGGDQWRTEGGLGCSNHPPPPEIPKALQNRAKLKPIVKTVKNC